MLTQDTIVRLFDNARVYYDFTLDHNNKFYLASYYWGDYTNKNSIHGYTYDQQVKNLISDCEKFKVNYFFLKINHKEFNYQDLLNLKPSFVYYCITRIPKLACIFVDTDLRMLKYPELLNTDNDVFVMNWFITETQCVSPYTFHIPGAVFGFGNTPETKLFLEKLIEHQPNTMEDMYMSMVLTRDFISIPLRVLALPTTYLFMFLDHKYTPPKYTYINSFAKELKTQGYRKNDIVFVHYDFETGSLDDVYEEKIKFDRFPKNYNSVMGKKLRCVSKKFIYYSNFGLNKEQEKQMLSDTKKFRKSMTIKRVKELTPYTLRIPNPSSGTTNILLTLYDNKTSSKFITNFVKTARHNNIRFILLKTKSIKKVNLPKLFYTVLSLTREGTCVGFFPDITRRIKSSYVKCLHKTNIDFCTENTNANNGKKSKCFDPRVLYSEKINFMMLKNCNVVKQFISIWNEHNKHTKEQHISLNNAFNVSMALPRLRCNWIPTQLTEKRLSGKILFGNNVEQCGTKEELDDGEPIRAHYFGSKRHRIEINRMLKL